MLTTEVFSDLISSNRQFAEIINTVFKEMSYNSYQADSALAGGAIVLKTFDYIKDSDLLLRFNTLEQSDADFAKQTLEQSLTKKGENVSILERLLNLPRIPETQIGLNECLRNVENSTGVERQDFRKGATSMYKTLEALWPKLYPPQAPPQQPTT